MRLALSHTSAGAFAQQQLLVARCTTAAPRSSQGAFTAVCTSSAPCRGRSSLSCAADARKRRSPPPQRTTNALDKRVFGAAVYSKVKHHVKATRCALIEGYFNSVTFLRDLGVEWKVANGRFVETHYPFLSYSTNMKEAVVRVTMYAIVDGRRRLVAGVEVVGKVHTDTYAVFKLKGLRKALEDMRVAKGHPLLLTGYFGEDGMLVVELEALETSAAAPAAAPTQVHVEAQEAAAPAVAQPAAGQQLMMQPMRQKAQEVAMPVAVPEPAPAATAQVEAEAADVTSPPGTTHITNNYYYTYHYTYNYYNRGNDLRDNHLGANEGHSGGW